MCLSTSTSQKPLSLKSMLSKKGERNKETIGLLRGLGKDVLQPHGENQEFMSLSLDKISTFSSDGSSFSLLSVLHSTSVMEKSH